VFSESAKHHLTKLERRRKMEGAHGVCKECGENFFVDSENCGTDESLCEDCNALVYVMDGEVRQTSNLEDHICKVEEAEETKKKEEPKMTDIVRVLRIIEYVGKRRWVEETVSNSIHGTKKITSRGRIFAATIGSYPEILKQEEHTPKKKEAKDDRRRNSSG